MRYSHFKIAVVSAVFVFISNFCMAQLDTSLVYAHIPRDHLARIITDPKTHVRYILDTSHIYIEAIDQNGKQLWKTDPWRAPELKFPEKVSPIIDFFGLRNDSSTHFIDVIEFGRERSGGRIDPKTGKVILIGQD
jgi:hypothetical protein